MVSAHRVNAWEGGKLAHAVEVERGIIALAATVPVAAGQHDGIVYPNGQLAFLAAARGQNAFRRIAFLRFEQQPADAFPVANDQWAVRIAESGCQHDVAKFFRTIRSNQAAHLVRNRDAILQVAFIVITP